MKKTGTIFDLYEKEIPEGKEGFFEFAKRAPEPKDNSFLSTLSDYGKTILKGTAEGLTRLGNVIGPTFQYPKFEEGQLKLPESREKQLEKQTESLDVLLPTEETFGQSAIRRGLREAPTMMAFPGVTLQTLPRSIAAGFMGESAKELGLPEWAQSAAEFTAYIGPDITKKLLSQGKNKELIEFAKKMGMTDEQITPLIQSEFKQKWLSKLSPKRGSTQTALENTKKGLDQTYSSITTSEIAKKEITESENGKLINSMFEKLNEMPRSLRDKIEPDLMDLLNNKITGKSLTNFWKDINSHFGPDTKQLGTLKESIKEALSSISPEMSKDFEMVNNLYSKYYPIYSKLKPNLASDILTGAEAVAGMYALKGAAFGDYSSLVAILGEVSAKKLAQQMLINPHFQQLSKKMVNAMNENKFGIVKKLSDSFANQIKKYSPELSEELEKISQEDLEKLFKYRDKKAE